MWGVEVEKRGEYSNSLTQHNTHVFFLRDLQCVDVYSAHSIAPLSPMVWNRMP